jgi:hypothetical protein
MVKALNGAAKRRIRKAQALAGWSRKPWRQLPSEGFIVVNTPFFALGEILIPLQNGRGPREL